MLFRTFVTIISIIYDIIPETYFFFEIRQYNSGMENEKIHTNGDYVIVKAEESGVTISLIPHDGNGADPSIRLDEGELLLMHLDNRIRGYKIRGKVELVTKLGSVKGHSSLIVGSD